MPNESDILVLPNTVPEGLGIKHRLPFWFDLSNRKDGPAATADEQHLLGGIGGITVTANHGTRIWGKAFFDAMIRLLRVNLKIIQLHSTTWDLR